ncbi:MAG: glucose-6-phosphate isomerase [Oscillospiraceae bacterium]|nr:glucose-6-phosphate isomerase [Oscillospiraceae bacterium]
MIKVDLSGTYEFFGEHSPDYAAAATAHRTLEEGNGPGAEFTGWLSLPEKMAGAELKSVLSASEKIRSHSEVLVVVGIGGSYLGARAATELLGPVCKDRREVLFVGNNLSADYLNGIEERLGERDFSVNVISKSGTTLEPALSFRVFKSLLEKKYGPQGAKSRIFATTDPVSGALRTMANEEEYFTLTVPGDVGGRYSVLSAVGLLPMSVAGIDVSKVTEVAIEQMRRLDLRSPENPAWQYAAARRLLYDRGKIIEIMAYYEPDFRYMAEWWKQLFGESEGKNGIGLFPASVEFTADLHSMGQFIQDGPRNLLETVVSFEKSNTSYKVPFDLLNADGFNYLAGRDFDRVNKTVAEAVKSAHISGGVPNIGISAGERNETGFAELICFFEVACGVSGYMSGVNPFDQPGVEAYKKNMFKLLSETAEHNA